MGHQQARRSLIPFWSFRARLPSRSLVLLGTYLFTLQERFPDTVHDYLGVLHHNPLTKKNYKLQSHRRSAWGKKKDFYARPRDPRVPWAGRARTQCYGLVAGLKRQIYLSVRKRLYVSSVVRPDGVTLMRSLRHHESAHGNCMAEMADVPRR